VTIPATLCSGRMHSRCHATDQSHPWGMVIYGPIQTPLSA